MANLPSPVTNTEMYLAAVLVKLEEIRCGLIDVEDALEKLANSPTQQPKISVQLDAAKVAESIKAVMQKSEQSAVKARK